MFDTPDLIPSSLSRTERDIKLVALAKQESVSRHQIYPGLARCNITGASHKEVAPSRRPITTRRTARTNMEFHAALLFIAPTMNNLHHPIRWLFIPVYRAALHWIFLHPSHDNWSDNIIQLPITEEKPNKILRFNPTRMLPPMMKKCDDKAKCVYNLIVTRCPMTRGSFELFCHLEEAEEVGWGGECAVIWSIQW